MGLTLCSHIFVFFLVCVVVNRLLHAAGQLAPERCSDVSFSQLNQKCLQEAPVSTSAVTLTPWIHKFTVGPPTTASSFPIQWVVVCDTLERSGRTGCTGNTEVDRSHLMQAPWIVVLWVVPFGSAIRWILPIRTSCSWICLYNSI